MSTLNDLRQELNNKERTITDLIRFIHTRTDNNPNYSLLLGAGCSITSGIRSASQLIKVWERELYEQLNDSEKEIENGKMTAFFNSQMWYDNRNPYSSLFEKKYDLPRQRRMFVEQEVGDKIPSIGYAYLIKLIEKNYFKTIFTTNFDDLLNEAFYQFSTQRPIVCAHDSSISSITITSKRPKIIKLHGDYLFDDIKSTLRETESLEENIRNKFVEFSKDYGLIVVGYGGNDRSIVDILTYLLKNEEYFKHGIYWCLRDGSYISEDLRKLLWKERVYYVSIQGFDELFSEIHNKLNQGEPPIDSSYFSKRKNNIIEHTLSNEYLVNSKCKYIQTDFEKLRSTQEKDIISNFLEYLDKNNDSESDQSKEFRKKDFLNEREFSEEEKESIIRIKNEFIVNNYKYALNLIDEKLQSTDSKSQFHIKLLYMQGRCLRELGEIDKAITVYSNLLEYDKHDIQSYIILSNLSVSLDDKIKYLDNAISIDKYSNRLLNKKATALFETASNSIDKDKKKETYDLIKNLINKSLELNPSFKNSAWYLQFELLEEEINDSNKLKTEYKSIIEKLELQRPNFPQIVNKKIKYLELNNESKEYVNRYIIETIENTINESYLKYNEFSLLDYYSKTNQKTEIKERLSFIQKTYEIDESYLIKKSTNIIK